MTILYLGTIGTSPELATLASFKGEQTEPAVLMSFYFLDKIKKTNEEQYNTIRTYKTMLDSGAYTAKSKNKKIDIDALCKEIKTGRWDEAAALDVIGDPEASYKNAIYMKGMGVNAFPTFHYGEPWEFLIEYAAKFDKTQKPAEMVHTQGDIATIFTALFGDGVTKLSQVPADGYGKAVAAVDAAISTNRFGR